jgi:hypothetical protein
MTNLDANGLVFCLHIFLACAASGGKIRGRSGVRLYCSLHFHKGDKITFSNLTFLRFECIGSIFL